MTVYRLIGPRGMVHGSIEEVLAAAIASIDPSLFYWFDDAEDITGVEVVERLLKFGDRPDVHDGVESVAFGRSVGGNPGDFRITRMPGGSEVKPFSDTAAAS